MDTSRQFIEELASHPSESLNVELKDWFDPSEPSGISKIVRGVFALRNRNGGYLLVGFNDKTLKPSSNGVPIDSIASFSVDIIQRIISDFAAEPFQITIEYVEIEGIVCPIICVPEGVIVPAVVRRDLHDGQKNLIRQDDIYFRTLLANGTPSSAKIKAGDWRALLDICFDNREADIGRFFRRHVSSEMADKLFGTFISKDSGNNPADLVQAQTIAVLTEGHGCFQEALAKRANPEATRQALEIGSWSVALTLNPLINTDDTSEEFLNIISSANPRYSGWPVWLDSRNFRDSTDRPRKRNGGWQSLILSPGRGFGAHLDFYRIHASGKFYMWRGLQDDLTDKVKPLTVFDPTLMVYRVIEVLVTALAFASALKYPENGTLGIAFKWEKMAGREMDPWADRMIYISGDRKCFDDTIESYIEMPVSTSISAVGGYAKAATNKLMGAFDGMSIPQDRYDTLVSRLLERKY